MKPAQIFHQYIWIINILRAYRQLTFEELNQKWQEDDVADGNPLQRSSFNRHRDAILNMFGVIIDCNKKTYRYYISNPDVLNDGSIERWLFSTADYTDFSFDIRPTADFLAELLSYGSTLEVLQPATIRQQFRSMVAETLKRY